MGAPEATYHLTHATLYLATAAKSNSVGLAIQAGKELVQNGPTPSVPLHLRSTGYEGARELGHGEDYVYPHNDSKGVVAQQYFPDGVAPRVIFRPGDHGEESDIGRRLEAIDRILGRHDRT